MWYTCYCIYIIFYTHTYYDVFTYMYMYSVHVYMYILYICIHYKYICIDHFFIRVNFFPVQFCPNVKTSQDPSNSAQSHRSTRVITPVRLWSCYFGELHSLNACTLVPYRVQCRNMPFSYALKAQDKKYAAFATIIAKIPSEPFELNLNFSIPKNIASNM